MNLDKRIKIGGRNHIEIVDLINKEIKTRIELCENMVLLDELMDETNQDETHELYPLLAIVEKKIDEYMALPEYVAYVARWQDIFTRFTEKQK